MELRRICGIFEPKQILHCCLTYVTKKINYLSKIIKCNEELIVKDIGSVNLFKKRFERGELFEKDISLYERSQNGDEIYVWEFEPAEKDKFVECVSGEKLIDIFLGIDEGRVYLKQGRFNTEDEGKRKLFDDNGYFINNPNYRFKEFEEDNELFKYCKLG